MKIKTISRTEEDYVRKTKLDITKVHRNRDPTLHPFERAREYTKALVATKLDKIFAKPFVASMDGHSDGIFCTSAVKGKVVPFLSGACDGEIKLWDLSGRSCVWTVAGHSGFVRGLAPDPEGATFFSCGDDKTIKQWAFDQTSEDEILPLRTIACANTVTSIDHHWVDNRIATGGAAVCVWDSSSHTKTDPLHKYSWGAENIISVTFNPAESPLLASTGSDRAICLYDLRASVPMHKFLLSMKSNKIAWNPREPMNFVVANEDFNLYSFDMRKIDKPLMIHKDHINAVMDVSFSPTGKEFVSGSYDHTVRIFRHDGGRSREVYFTKRMQRVFAVNYSTDGQFVMSGSDDMNIRIWKANAAQALGIQKARKDRKEEYNQAIKKRFAHMPEIKRLNNDKKIPKFIKKANQLRHIQGESERRKIDNRKRHTKSEDSQILPERKRVVVKEID